jgi:hypothetical protein
VLSKSVVELINITKPEFDADFEPSKVNLKKVRG